MASIGHIAVGMAAGRGLASRRDQLLRWSLWFVAVSCAADLDLAALLVGLRSNSIWGHRGFTHSLSFAVLAAVVSAGLARRWAQPAGRWAAMGFAAYASHLVLDCLNVGAVGVPWLWPLSSAYHTIPWSPIPAVKEAAEFLTPAAIPVVAAEIVLFAPFWLYGLLRPPADGPAAVSQPTPRRGRVSWRPRRRGVQGAVE